MSLPIYRVTPRDAGAGSQWGRSVSLWHLIGKPNTRTAPPAHPEIHRLLRSLQGQARSSSDLQNGMPANANGRQAATSSPPRFAFRYGETGRSCQNSTPEPKFGLATQPTPHFDFAAHICLVHRKLRNDLVARSSLFTRNTSYPCPVSFVTK